MNHVVIVADMEIMDFTTWTSSQQGWSGYSCRRVPGLSAAEANGEPQVWHRFLGWPASHLVARQQHWTTSSLGRPASFPYWNRYLFLHIMPLQNLPSYQKLYPPSWCSTQHCFWPRNWFTVREVWPWAHVLPCSHHSEAASLVEWWNGLLKTLLNTN